ncbi:adenylate/guanylate cyclase domain-containing protein [Steroidobacter agaridevorans]|uniref:adenylate/guanylate cyclase domain-containing protein n=1 Tax=Steroidobacter agaridevorans TaxID=2695856 RepID=UPI00132941AC|nr:adenylate/guanylate cyclase domain-containing protein [Steroidobacter agaridevorans]GFE87312.1 guanylate cyclase [Steroidobacter agaridevorans]
MTLNEDLQREVRDIFRSRWAERDGRIVPSPEDLSLGNDAVKLDACVLYADMSDSTDLVDDYEPQFAAEVYKSYLTCAARILKSEGATITAYDGDRIMAVFVGDSQASAAARAGLKLNSAVLDIINPALLAQYNAEYRLSHVVGIDCSPLFASRIGVRNDNDIVWVGRSANYAAKLCALNEPNTVYITGDVFDRLDRASKCGGERNELMWSERRWTQRGNMRIHSSQWKWRV